MVSCRPCRGVPPLSSILLLAASVALCCAASTASAQSPGLSSSSYELPAKAGRILPGTVVESSLFDDRVSLSAGNLSGSDLFGQRGIMFSDDLTSSQNLRQEIDLKVNAFRSTGANLNLHTRYARGRVPGRPTRLGSLKQSLAKDYTYDLQFGHVTRWTELSQSDLGADLSLFSNRLHLSSTYTSSTSVADIERGLKVDYGYANDSDMSRHDHRLNANILRGRPIDLSVSASFGGYSTLTRPNDEYFQSPDRGESTTEGQTWSVGGNLSRGPVRLRLTHRDAGYTYESLLYDGLNPNWGTTREDRLQRLRSEVSRPGTKGKVDINLNSVIGSADAGLLGRFVPTKTWFQASRSQRVTDGKDVAKVSDGAGFGFSWEGDLTTASIGVSRTADDNRELGKETADRDNWLVDFNYDFFGDVWGITLYLFATHNAYKETGAGSLEMDIAGGVSYSLYMEELPNLTVAVDLNRNVLEEYDFENTGVSDYFRSYVSLDFSKYLPASEAYKPFLKFAYQIKLNQYADSEFAERPDLNHTCVVWSGIRF